MMVIDHHSLLSFQRDPLVPNKKKDIDSPQERLGQAPDRDVARTIRAQIGRTAHGSASLKMGCSRDQCHGYLLRSRPRSVHSSPFPSRCVGNDGDGAW